MRFETVELPNTKFRFVFDTTDPKELTAHLETLDALQVRRPRHLQTPRRMWAADVWMDGEDSPLRVWSAPEDIEHELARLKKQHEDYFKTEVRITNLRPDNLN